VSSLSRVPLPRLAADHSRSRAYRLAVLGPSRSLPNRIDFPGCWPGKSIWFGLGVLGHDLRQAYVFGQGRRCRGLQQPGQRLQGD
jgi:hypothetical protein